MQRRAFIQSAGLALSAAAVRPVRPVWGFPVDHPYLKTLGLQLWTVRNQMKEDAATTIKAVAAAGYQQVETNVDDLDRDVALAKENGLTVTSFFNDWRTLADPDDKTAMSMEATIEAATKHDIRHIVFGYIGPHCRKTIDQYKATAERTNKAAELCRASGLRLCYHNHSFEFEKLEGDQCGFDVFMNEFDDELMEYELDVFWAAIGGWNPLETMKKLGQRISQLHLKDLKKDTPTEYDEGEVPSDAFKELGNGTIDIQAVIDLGLELGVEQCHVEQDQSPAPLQSIVTSYQHLRAL